MCELIEVETSSGEEVLYCIECGEYVEEPCEEDEEND